MIHAQNIPFVQWHEGYDLDDYCVATVVSVSPVTSSEIRSRAFGLPMYTTNSSGLAIVIF